MRSISVVFWRVKFPNLSWQLTATEFLTRTRLSDISRISRLPLEMKGLGGVKEVLQFTSKNEANEQPDPIPMPNGYGTVKFPHWLWQPGFAVAEACETKKMVMMMTISRCIDILQIN